MLLNRFIGDDKKVARKVGQEAIRFAIEDFNPDRAKAGDIVSHRDDQTGYKLISINKRKGTARVYIPADKSKSGKEIRKELPLDGMFNAAWARHCVLNVEVMVIFEALSKKQFN